jgi:hypothetical protein
MIYLASPYSDPDHRVMRRRFTRTCQLCADLMLEGKVVYSPIAHNHPIAQFSDLPRDWAFWRKFDIPMLDLAKELYVYQLDGWDKSTGVSAEIHHAINRNIPVKFIPQ